MNHTRFERMKQLAKALAAAAKKANKEILEAERKQLAAMEASTSYVKKPLMRESDIAMGAALAALDECAAVSVAAINASRS